MADPEQERVELHEHFVSRFGRPRWGESHVSRPMAAASIARLEAAFSLVFPESLKLLLRRHGDVALPELSRTWLFAGDCGCPVPIDEFFGVETMPLANGTAWLAPIPRAVSGTSDLPLANAFEYLISFAGDGGGNWFCFRRLDCGARKDDLPVFYFDHDGGAIEQIASGLDELLAQYLNLPDVMARDSEP